MSNGAAVALGAAIPSLPFVAVAIVGLVRLCCINQLGT